MRPTLPTLTLALILAVPATGFAQNKVEQQMFAELRMMQEQMQRLQSSVNSLAESVKAVTTKQEEQTNATRKAFADQKLLTDAITDSIRILREKGDDTNVRISTVANELQSMRQSQQALQNSVVQVVAAINAQNSGAPASADPAAGAGSAAVPTVNQAATQSPKVLYDAAWGDYASARYELAIQGFQAYLRTFPNSPDAYLAQFNIGESYFGLNRWREAVQAYREVIDNYKKSPVEPDAYYRQARAYIELNMKDPARTNLAFIIKTYPDSTIAPLAKQLLEGIK